jgi:rsbT co-antagonist protein RsbR
MARIKSDKAGTIKLQTPELLKRKEKGILDTWMKNQLTNITLRLDLISKEDLETQSKEFLKAFIKAISTGNMEDIEAPEYKPVIKMLQDISRTRAVQGFPPSETATYIFSLQDTILQYLQMEYVDKPEIINLELVLLSKLIFQLGLVTFETFY